MTIRNSAYHVLMEPVPNLCEKCNLTPSELRVQVRKSTNSLRNKGYDRHRDLQEVKRGYLLLSMFIKSPTFSLFFINE